jgi:hypothetical protein
LDSQRGPVNTWEVTATEAIFSQVKAARVPCSCAAQASANAESRNKWPRPLGLRLKSGQAALLVVHLAWLNLSPRALPERIS